ncbi:MAG: hydrolase [Bacteroidales bacterium]|jgi:nicotinamidase-related amidase|nr:hydrolase [Bacteroidales bacterium]
MRILVENTAALIIDFQEKIFPMVHESKKLEHNVPLLIRGLKTLEVPLFATEQYVKGLGPTIPIIADQLEGLERIGKMSFSCCDEPKLMLDLAASGKEFVVVAGIESHVCVLQTVIDLKHNGYYPVVVEDCISSRNPNDKLIALERMRHEGIAITTCESILFELLRTSGSEKFKTISKLVK